MNEKWIMWLAWRLPRRLVYWCAVRLMANPDYVGVVSDFTCLEALKHWNERTDR